MKNQAAGEYQHTLGEAYVQLGGKSGMGGFSQRQLLVLRGVFASAALAMFMMIVYTCWTDGSPFRKKLLIPWMVATLQDFYTNQLVIYMWAFYKEETAVARVLVLILMICLGSLTTCLYVLYHLMKMSPVSNQGTKELLLNPKHLVDK